MLFTPGFLDLLDNRTADGVGGRGGAHAICLEEAWEGGLVKGKRAKGEDEHRERV
jgi:hypothetical protein